MTEEVVTSPRTDEIDYLRLILTARVYDVAKETPLQRIPLMSDRLGAHVLLKREDLQPVFSFKIRGAYNKMRNLTDSERKRGVVAVSAGMAVRVCGVWWPALTDRTLLSVCLPCPICVGLMDLAACLI